MRIDPELVARFRADLARVWPAVKHERRTLGLAVSGGGDSLAMLLLAAAALPGRVQAATVDHCLRAESAREAAFVAIRCAELGVPHATLAVEVGQGNLQDRARSARYEALGRWCEDRGLAGLATAHQLDDQVETVLMRLNRGSGVAGLSAIRAAQTAPHATVPLLRPLLEWRRDELADVVRDAGWEAIADPSNEDDRFDRVRLRKALASADWFDRANIARSAALLAEAQDSLIWAVGREVTQHVRLDRQETSYAALAGGAPALIRVEAVRTIYRFFGAEIDRRGAAGLIERLIGGQTGNVAGLQFGARGKGSDRLWLFRPENPRRTS